MRATTDADTRFWDRIAPRYAKKPVPDAHAYEQTLERVRAHLRPSDRVLEIGCGTGTTALKLAPHAAEIVATDLSREMIAIATSKAAAQGVDNVRFACGTLDDPALEAEGFDVVLAFNVCHLMADLPAALERARSLLRPGGFLIAKTPCLGDYFPLLRVFVSVLRALGLAPRVHYFTKSQFCQAVREAGFEPIETGLYPAKSHSQFVVARAPGAATPESKVDQ